MPPDLPIACRTIDAAKILVLPQLAFNVVYLQSFQVDINVYTGLADKYNV